MMARAVQTPGDPDPLGRRMERVRAFLLAGDFSIEGLFWDFGSLFQKPRDQAQDGRFGLALDVMADLCELSPALALLLLWS